MTELEFDTTSKSRTDQSPLSNAQQSPGSNHDDAAESSLRQSGDGQSLPQGSASIWTFLKQCPSIGSGEFKPLTSACGPDSFVQPASIFTGLSTDFNTYPKFELEADQYDIVCGEQTVLGTGQDLPEYLRESWKYCNPSEPFEIYVLDFRLARDQAFIAVDCPTQRWVRAMRKGMKINEPRFETLACEKRDVGFSNIVCRLFRTLCGSWPQDEVFGHIGSQQLEAMQKGIHGLSQDILEAQGMSLEESHAFLESMLSKLFGKGSRSYSQCAVLYGLSPLVKAASCVYNGYPDEIEAHPPSQGCAEEPYGHRRKRPRLDNLQNDSESTSEVDNSALLGEDATIHDDDSGFGMSNRSSSLTSVDSSLLEHILLKAGSYMLPNDKQEDRRLDLQHDLFTKILDGQPCVTKLEDASFILDIGTGNGRWAGDIAWKYPAARVIGIDQFPVLQRWLPQNLTFFVDDINESIPFENVDFIHVRTLAGSIQDWPKFLQQCHESLNPGGKIEISEIQLKFGCEDVTYHNDSATLQWSKELHKRYEEVGSMLDIIPKVQPWLEEVGFETVKTSHQFLPTGPWSDDAVQKERGEMARELQHHSFEAYGLAVYTREGQWSTEEYQILIAMARREVCVMPLHTNVSFVTATKPSRS